MARYIANSKEKMFYVKTTCDYQYLEIDLQKKDYKRKTIFGSGSEKNNPGNFSKEEHITYYCEKDKNSVPIQIMDTCHDTIPDLLERIKYWIGKSENVLLKFTFNLLCPSFASVSSKYEFIRGSYRLNRLKENEVLRPEDIENRPNGIRVISSKKALHDEIKELIPMYNLKHLNDTFLEEKNYDLVKVPDEIKESYAIHKDDILISIRGTSFKTALVLDEPQKPSIISGNICILRRREKNYLPEEIMGDYIFIKSPVFKDFIDYLTPPSEYTNLNQKIFDTLYVPAQYTPFEKRNFQLYRKEMEIIKQLREHLDSIEETIFRQDLLTNS